MNDSELKRLVNILENNRTKYLWKSDELEEFLTSKNFMMNRENLLRLIDRLSEGYIFRWLDFVGVKMPEIASSDVEFIRLLTKIIKKVKGDMAQGPLIRGLINVGSTNPQIGLALFDKMVETADEDSISYAGLVLGGVGKRDFENGFKKIEDEIERGDSRVKSTCIKSLRVIFEEAQIKEEKRIFEILKSAADVNEDSLTQSEAANAYIEFHRFNPQECIEQLLYLAKQGDSNVRFTIAQRLWLVDLKDGKDEMKILRECARDGDLNTVARVAAALGKKGKHYPEESLEIIENWIKRKIYRDISNIDYCLQEIGKGTLNKCIEIVGSWIETEKDPIIRFYIPDVLTALSANDYRQLIDHLQSWSAVKGTLFQGTIIRTIRNIILGLHKAPSPDAITDCLSLLKDFAKNDELRDAVTGALAQIFGNKPRFAKGESLVNFVEEWVYEEDWKTRRAIIVALEILARDKIDVKETLKIQVDKETKETKVVGTIVEEIQLVEGMKGYQFLQKLTTDKNPLVKEEAVDVLKRVNGYLKEKELRIKKACASVMIEITQKIPPHSVLKTPSGKAEFEFYHIDDKEVVIETEGGSRIRIPARCFEDVPILLRGRGWIRIGAVHGTSQEGTLDRFVKRFTSGISVASYVAPILEKAGIVNIDRRYPAKIRLKAPY